MSKFYEYSRRRHLVQSGYIVSQEYFLLAIMSSEYYGWNMVASKDICSPEMSTAKGETSDEPAGEERILRGDHIPPFSNSTQITINPRRKTARGGPCCETFIGECPHGYSWHNCTL